MLAIYVVYILISHTKLLLLWFNFVIVVMMVDDGWMDGGWDEIFKNLEIILNNFSVIVFFM